VKRELPLVAVIAPALLIVAAVGYFLLVKPKQDESGRLAQEITELQTKVDAALAAKRKSGNEPDTTIRIADLFGLTKAMPDKTDMAGIMLELDSVASSAGVGFASITPGAVALKSGYSAVPINLTFQGSYYDLADFLFRLRNLVVVRDGKLGVDGRLFSLDSLSLQEGPNGLPQVQAALTVNAYVYTGGQSAAPAPTAPTPTTTGNETAQAGATG
jgi:type IV pilus assembly protein PilO